MNANMRFAHVAALLLLALPACVGAGRSSSEPVGLRADVESAHDGLVASFRAGDLAGVARGYTDDAVMLGPDGYRIQGKEAMEKYWTGLRGGRDWTLEALDVDGDRDLVFELGRSTLVHENHDGQIVTSVVKFVGVWRRQPDGSLKLAVDAWWHDG